MIGFVIAHYINDIYVGYHLNTCAETSGEELWPKDIDF